MEENLRNEFRKITHNMMLNIDQQFDDDQLLAWIDENFEQRKAKRQVDLLVIKNFIKSAEIKKYKGKYYGTVIKINLVSGNDIEFDIWENADFKPSIREIESWGGIENVEICDSHFESEFTYSLAKFIVDAINSL